MATYEVAYRRIQVINLRVVASNEDEAILRADRDLERPSTWTCDGVELVG